MSEGRGNGLSIIREEDVERESYMSLLLPVLGMLPTFYHI